MNIRRYISTLLLLFVCIISLSAEVMTNVRSVVRQDGAVVESTDYYPYGTPFTTAGAVQPYKFYQLYRNVQAASHTYVPHVETYHDEEFKVHGYTSTKIPTNIALEKQIELVTNQAKQNRHGRKNRK